MSAVKNSSVSGKISKDTAKVLSDGEKIHGLVQHTGWSTAKRILLLKMTEIDSVGAMDIDGLDAQKLLLDIRIRQGVIDLITRWLQEIEGNAHKYEMESKTMKQIREDEIISRFE